MSKAADALACKKQGYSCSQAVLSTFAEELDLDKATALRIADGFGGGMGGKGGTCGVVTGGIMAIGLKYGRADADDMDAKVQTVKHVRELMERFRHQQGSLLCKDLIGCEIDTPEKAKAAHESGRFAVCNSLIATAVGILENIL